MDFYPDKKHLLRTVQQFLAEVNRPDFLKILTSLDRALH